MLRISTSVVSNGVYCKYLLTDLGHDSNNFGQSLVNDKKEF